MKNLKLKAFTLVELIVGITISMLLMVSIGVFVSSGMQNIFLQQKALQNISDINDFATELNETISDFKEGGKYEIKDNSIIFKRNKSYNKGGFSYIGVVEKDEFFCDDPKSENTKTKHIFIKNFIPFIEDGEDVSDMGDLFKSEITFNGKTIKSLQKEHKIVDEDGETIVGKGIFGDKIKEGQDAKEVYLNSPTGIATDLEKLYISDTLNDRILYLSGSNIYTLLDETDGLNEPTGLYFDDSEKALYIANSGSGEVLKFSSLKLSEIPVFNFSGVTSSVSEISITLLLNGKKKELTNTGIELENFGLDTIPSPPPNQSFETATAEATLSGGSIIYKFKTETYSGGTLDNTIFPNPKDRNMDFYANQTYTIKFNEQNEFWEAGNYAVNIKFGDELNEEKFYFFTQGDEKIYTKNDNILEVVNYPNGIISNTNFEQFNVSGVENLSFDEENDIILKVPIESLEISENGEDLINIILKYYRNYNCYNLDENKEKIETFISKINLNK